MGLMWTKAVGCDYTEYDRALTEEFIIGIGNEGMTGEILREVSALENTDDTTGERVLLSVQSVECKW